MAPNHTPPTHTVHNAPFTDTQIAQLAAWQRAAGTGALMCGAPRHEHVPLIPDRGGLRCSLSGCSYTQTWAPAHALETTPSSTGAVIEIEPGTAVVNGHPVSLVQPTVHACPPDGSGIMPCCGRTPFEAAGDQLAANPELVTCPGRPVQARHCGEECSEGHVHAGRCAQPIEPTPPPDGQELAEARNQANGWERKYFEMVEKRTRLAERLDLAHKARGAKEAQLDDVRRALCDTGLMHDDDPYSHADLADVIRQTANTPAITPSELAYALDNATPYPVELTPTVATFMAAQLTEMLGTITKNPEHPVWQPEEPPGPSPAPQNPDAQGQPGSPESILVALHKLHSRGPGQQRTPLGMVDADDVCITCHTPWPCPTGRIIQETP